VTGWQRRYGRFGEEEKPPFICLDSNHDSMVVKQLAIPNYRKTCVVDELEWMRKK
jgi:hypothetical protein